MVSFRLDPPRPVLKKISTAKIYFPNKVNTGELKISEHISTAEAEIKKKRGQLSLLRSRLGRSCCPTPSTHRRFTTGESPESTENSRATDNVSPAQVDALKAEIMELEGNLTSLRQSVFDTFEQLLAVSLQAPFRKIVAEQCDSADYVDRYLRAPWSRLVRVSSGGHCLAPFARGRGGRVRGHPPLAPEPIILNMDKAPVEALIH